MDHVLEALQFLNPADLDYDSWLRIGMALKNEGYPVEVWEEWSQGEARYHPGECERKWASFDGYIGTKVGSGSIIQIAKEHGWHSEYNRELGWEDEIAYDGERQDTGNRGQSTEEETPVEQFRCYLEALFQPDDIIGYVTGEVWKNDEGRYLPSKGVFNRTAGELIALLEKYPDDLGAVIGDWKEECGAWIRFNPLDGKGVKNENVTDFRFALVESDTMPLEEQEKIYRNLQLPIAALVYCGGKSLHAIVHSDAKDYGE